MVVVTKDKLVIYQIYDKKIIFVKDGNFWDACFVPKSKLVAVVVIDES
jgi:hypothetical protein